MSTKNKSTKNSCWIRCIGKWIVGKDLATFVLAGIGFYTAIKAPDIFNEITKLQSSNGEIKQATAETIKATQRINETVNFLKDEWTKITGISKFENITQKVQSEYNPDKKVAIFAKTLKDELDPSTKSSGPWKIHMEEKDIENMIQKFKNKQDLTSLKNEFLQKIKPLPNPPKQNGK